LFIHLNISTGMLSIFNGDLFTFPKITYELNYVVHPLPEIKIKLLLAKNKKTKKEKWKNINI